MKNIKSRKGAPCWIHTLWIWFITCMFTACDKPTILLNQPNEDIRSIGGFIENNYDFTLLAAALKYTGLIDTLSKQGEFTLLAPDNNAFNEMGITDPEEFQRMNKDSLRKVLEYHIMPYVLREADVPEGIVDLRYQTIGGDSLYVSRVTSVYGKYIIRGGLRSAISNTAITFSGADAVITDRTFSNGVFHSLAKIIKPFPQIKIQTWLEARPQYSTFVAGLKKFGLWDALAGEGPFTIFVPPNEILASDGITADFVQNLSVSDYIGERLFGSYIMYNKRYFILDQDFYLHRQKQMWFVNPVYSDDEYYHIFFGAPDRPWSILDIQQKFTREEYTLGISKSVSPSSAEDYIGGTTVRSGGSSTTAPMGLYKAKTDYMCTNGLVHEIHGTLVLPDRARTSDDF